MADLSVVACDAPAAAEQVRDSPFEPRSERQDRRVAAAGRGRGGTIEPHRASGTATAGATGRAGA
ncbi:hypothetical protein [Streptosporangium roseum]|uniref:Uncharacterized protein n=1 Tax=Streptosporangium roseum (strain ATCC 12428 / DSM 43021 / JCM 3005 / KCTC 9067 / NCIMB 10171 / NRRL 2505 / NI 9100) TaxID=479432 RepID=D2BAQ9_STRRD|nr:hypothetical protein [Streptosporangium roseum]ACZ89889.1 hypothetical protein Sros_7199 [Streptosporangium roseum DSM 43021]